jgi:hypothetical protein
MYTNHDNRLTAAQATALTTVAANSAVSAILEKVEAAAGSVESPNYIQVQSFGFNAPGLHDGSTTLTPGQQGIINALNALGYAVTIMKGDSQDAVLVVSWG